MLAGRIEYDPVMPAARDQLCQRMPMGSLMKCEAVYNRPFWRADGLTGQGIVDAGPAKAIFDNSPPEGTPGILLGFVGGDALRAWGGRTLADRRRAVLANFAQCFGPEALKPVDYFEQDWSREQWTGGCPVGVAAPGALLRFGHALREPVGHIHWAGTETATYWNGYMDGAVSSGIRAAAEV
jgi:monoamine oxidase